LVRRVEGLKGRVEMRTELAPRPEYGLVVPHLRLLEPPARGVEAVGGPVRLLCTGPLPWELADGSAASTFTVAAGDDLTLRLAAETAFPEPEGTDADRAADVACRADADDTITAWRSWASDHVDYDGSHPDLVRRAAVVLQGLTYAPSGAVVAAATTSLPETNGGDDTWDYRFAWVRDLSLTARALWFASCPDEPRRLFRWLTTAMGHLDGQGVQIVYGVGGERDLTERVLPHLPGYRGARPVRAGNDAWRQRQFDVMGEVLDAAHLVLGHDPDPLPPDVADLLVGLAEQARRFWREPDAGMWEARDAERHYTSSKVMCWVALDRAVTLAPRLGPRADTAGWAAARDEIRSSVLDQAWHEGTGAYTGAFGSDRLDASVLLMPLVGFLPVDDPRMAATIERVAERLGEGQGLVLRWEGDPAGFLLCSFWLVECLAMAGEHERAQRLFDLAAGRANDLGLLAEEADPRSGAPRGNAPQAFSHVGLVNAAWRLAHPEPVPR
jgi:GH15 family glucan-1,4-alpha-glucosidase